MGNPTNKSVETTIDSTEIKVTHKPARKTRHQRPRRTASTDRHASSKRDPRRHSLMHLAVQASKPTQTELAEFMAHYRRYQAQFLAQQAQPWHQYGQTSVLTTQVTADNKTQIIEYEFYEGTQGTEANPWFADLLTVDAHYGLEGTLAKALAGIAPYRQTTARQAASQVNIQTLSAYERLIINATLYQPGILAIIFQWLLEDDICKQPAGNHPIKVCIKRLWFNPNNQMMSIDYGINTHRTNPPLVYQHTQRLECPIAHFARLCTEAFLCWETSPIIVTQHNIEFGPIAFHDGPLRYSYNLLAKQQPDTPRADIAMALPDASTVMNIQHQLVKQLYPKGLPAMPIAKQETVPQSSTQSTTTVFDRHQEMAAMRWWVTEKYLRPRMAGLVKSTDRFDSKHIHALKLIHALAYAANESECVYIYKGFLKGRYGFPQLIRYHWRFCGIEIGRSELYRQVLRRYRALKPHYPPTPPTTCSPFIILKSHYASISSNDEELQQTLQGFQRRFSNSASRLKTIDGELENCLSQLTKQQQAQHAYQDDCRKVQDCEKTIQQQLSTISGELKTLQKTIATQQQAYFDQCRQEHENDRVTKDGIKQDIQQQNHLLSLLSPQWQPIDIPDLNPTANQSFIQQLQIEQGLTLGDATMDEVQSYFSENIHGISTQHNTLTTHIQRLSEDDGLLGQHHQAQLQVKHQQLMTTLTALKATVENKLNALAVSITELERLLSDSLPYVKFSQSLKDTHQQCQQMMRRYQQQLQQARSLLADITQPLAKPPQANTALTEACTQLTSALSATGTAQRHCQRHAFALIRLRHEMSGLQRQQRRFGHYVNERFNDIMLHACQQTQSTDTTDDNDGSQELLQILQLSSCTVEHQPMLMHRMTGLINQLKARYLTQPPGSQAPIKTPAYSFIETILQRRLNQLLEQISGQQQPDDFYADTRSALTACAALSIAVTTADTYYDYYKKIKQAHKEFGPRKHWYSSEKVKLAFPLDDPSEFTDTQRQSVTASFR